MLNRISQNPWYLTLSVTALSVCLAIFTVSNPAKADDRVFDGKTITYVVGSKPGGGYDRYLRLIAPFFKKYLPGSTVVPVNKPAGGGVAALNEIYARDPDGLKIMSFNTGLLLSQIGGKEGIEFDTEKLGWIGKAGSESRVMLVRNETGVETLDDLRRPGDPFLFVSSAFGSASFIQTNLLADAFNLNIVILPGFGGREAEAALFKGEIDGVFVSESNVAPLVDAGIARAIVLFGNPTDPRLLTVPLGVDIAETDDQRLVAQQITIMTELGRLTATSPDTPAPILEALRTAYEKALRDPELLAKAAQQNSRIDFLSGLDVERLVHQYLQSGEHFRILVERTLQQ